MLSSSDRSDVGWGISTFDLGVCHIVRELETSVPLSPSVDLTRRSICRWPLSNVFVYMISPGDGKANASKVPIFSVKQ